jgi:hypothetical protein
VHSVPLADAAWLAGLLEGEGCWCLSKQPDKVDKPLIRLAMTDREPVEKAYETCGQMGSFYLRSRPPSMHAHHKDQWIWNVQSAPQVVAISNLVLPWMSPRRTEKIQECLKAATLVGTTGRKRSPKAAKHLVLI